MIHNIRHILHLEQGVFHSEYNFWSPYVFRRAQLTLHDPTPLIGQPDAGDCTWVIFDKRKKQLFRARFEFSRDPEAPRSYYSDRFIAAHSYEGQTIRLKELVANAISTSTQCYAPTANSHVGKQFYGEWDAAAVQALPEFPHLYFSSLGAHLITHLTNDPTECQITNTKVPLTSEERKTLWSITRHLRNHSYDNTTLLDQAIAKDPQWIVSVDQELSHRLGNLSPDRFDSYLSELHQLQPKTHGIVVSQVLNYLRDILPTKAELLVRWEKVGKLVSTQQYELTAGTTKVQFSGVDFLLAAHVSSNEYEDTAIRRKRFLWVFEHLVAQGAQLTTVLEILCISRHFFNSFSASQLFYFTDRGVPLPDRVFDFLRMDGANYHETIQAYQQLSAYVIGTDLASQPETP